MVMQAKTNFPYSDNIDKGSNRIRVQFIRIRAQLVHISTCTGSEYTFQ